MMNSPLLKASTESLIESNRSSWLRGGCMLDAEVEKKSRSGIHTDGILKEELEKVSRGCVENIFATDVEM
jgi:hypothetical protein